MIKRFVFILVFASLLFLPPRAWSEETNPLTDAAIQPATAPGDPLLLEVRREMEAGDWRKARRTLKKFISDNKKSPEGWTLLARTYMATGSNGKALRRFDKALKFDPHYAPAFLGRGELFEKKGRLDEAANDFRAAMLSDPHLPEARQGLARVNPAAPPSDSNPF